jgi:DNA helicase-2/ATP-dependent DNA helicase PcrA
VLRCSWAAERTFGTRVSNRQPSPYLLEIREVLDGLAAGRRPVDGLVEVRRERKRLHAEDGRGPRAGPRRHPSNGLSDGDLAVLDALKEWRATQARLAKVRAAVVFTDEDLESVAVNRPRDVDGLIDVAGVSKIKAIRYGESLLAVVADHS